MEEKEFERLLKIARLKLSEREMRRIKEDIDEVLRYFDKISRFDAKDEPAYQPIHVPTKFRKDRIDRFEDVEALKKGSRLHNGYIIGPKL